MGSQPTPLIVLVAGTGTEVGKTYVSCALLRAWGQRTPVHGYKPIETGVPRGEPGLTGDGAALEAASTFHVKHPPFRQTYVDPISPHLAARRERRPVDLSRLAREARRLAREAGAVVETAGGLFSPLGPGVTNADLAAAIAPARLVVVAPDRLGVLHDVGATLRAAASMRLRVDGVVVSSPERPDASTGTNAREMARVLGVNVLAEFPWAPGRSGAAPARRAALALLRALKLP